MVIKRGSGSKRLGDTHALGGGAITSIRRGATTRRSDRGTTPRNTALAPASLRVSEEGIRRTTRGKASLLS